MTRRQAIEGALGLMPLPTVVSMLGDCPEPPGQHVIAKGTLEPAEPIEGSYYHIAGTVLMLSRNSDQGYTMRSLSGKEVEIIVRELPPKPTLEKLRR